MRRICLKQWAATALAGASLLAARADAADVGAIRITDSASAVPAGATPVMSTGYSSGPVAGYGHDCHAHAGCPPHAGCHPWGCHPCGHLHGLAQPLHHVHAGVHHIHAGLQSYITTTQGLLAHSPIYHLPVHYQRFWPTHWYGQPGAVYSPIFPMVYMPTDTTQLGFYYQRVPYWQPRPGLLPPAPNGGASGLEGAFGGLFGVGAVQSSCPSGAYQSGTIIESTPQPAEQPTEAPSTPPPSPPVEASIDGIRDFSAFGA